MANTSYSTPNIECLKRMRSRLRNFGWLAIGAWLLVDFSVTLHAQLPQRIPPGGAAQLQIQQAPVDVSQPAIITARAVFDPPAVSIGGKTFYRVEVEATQNSISWPEKITAPAGLRFGANARSQLSRLEGNKFRPLTAFLHEVTPTATGEFVIPRFVVAAGGQTVAIPEARLKVLAAGAAPAEPVRRLRMDFSETNLFVGQPFRVRVLLPAGPRNEIEALREIQLNGTGFMTDKLTTRQAVEAVNLDEQLKPAFVYETVATPLTAGALAISAQAFSAGGDFPGPISISGQVTLPGGPPRYVLLLSDTTRLVVRPLPSDDELPGVTGTMGQFIAEKPQLSARRLRVGEPVHLQASFRGEGKWTRLVPPVAPRVRDWQIIADQPPNGGFTLIPLTDEATNTPAIPFCAFNPATGKFYDLTIPPLPVTVIGEGLPTELRTWEKDEAHPEPMKLGALATAPGKSVRHLTPLQLRGWFVALQFLPVLGFIALWRWDEHRRFLAAHPEIVRRRRAKRELRRERNHLQQAVAAGDTGKFLQHAATALRMPPGGTRGRQGANHLRRGRTPVCRDPGGSGRLAVAPGRCERGVAAIGGKIMRPFLLIILGLIIGTPLVTANTNDPFAQGIAFSQQGNFPEAAAAFESALRRQPSVGAFLNLGQVEWQRGHAGRAILAWERAAWIAPADPRPAQNLKFARAAAQVNEPEWKWHETISRWLPPNAWVWLAGAALWLAVGTLTLPRFFRWPKSDWQPWLAAAGFGVLLFCLTASYGVISRTHLGFVIKRNAPLLLIPAATSERVTTLPAGEPARQLKAHGNYYFVQTAFGGGWIERKNLGLINEP
jgi:tetratricopeptide (TPR) repeat protein